MTLGLHLREARLDVMLDSMGKVRLFLAKLRFICIGKCADLIPRLFLLPALLLALDRLRDRIDLAVQGLERIVLLGRIRIFALGQRRHILEALVELLALCLLGLGNRFPVIALLSLAAAGGFTVGLATGLTARGETPLFVAVALFALLLRVVLLVVNDRRIKRLVDIVHRKLFVGHRSIPWFRMEQSLRLREMQLNQP